MKREITPDILKTVLQSSSLSDLTIDELFSFFRNENGLADYAPDGVCREDPRDGSMVVYNSKRAKRPHDNRSDNDVAEHVSKPCPVCEGNTTGVVDVAPLSEGFTFINKNLFPCFYDNGEEGPSQRTDAAHPFDGKIERPSLGLHFLQWTSSKHHSDWHNADANNLKVVIERLGKLEQKLLFESKNKMPSTKQWHRGKETFGFVTIIKNLGAAVGGSLVHGHQQIGFSNTMSTQAYNNWRFKEKNKKSFSSYLLENNPENLLVKDYGPAQLVVPYFMKRPYFTMLLLKDTEKQFVHELNDDEQLAVAKGWSDCARAIKKILEGIGREFAYNAVIHNGPGAGLYIEFFPFSQETGGFEQSGIWVCQENPESAARRMRQILEQ